MEKIQKRWKSECVDKIKYERYSGLKRDEIW